MFMFYVIFSCFFEGSVESVEVLLQCLCGFCHDFFFWGGIIVFCLSEIFYGLGQNQTSCSKNNEQLDSLLSILRIYVTLVHFASALACNCDRIGAGNAAIPKWTNVITTHLSDQTNPKVPGLETSNETRTRLQI